MLSTGIGGGFRLESLVGFAGIRKLGLYGRRIVFVQGQNFPFTRNRRMVKTDVETSPP